MTMWPGMPDLLEKTETIDTAAVAAAEILQFIERVEQIESEISDLNEGKKDVFAEAKGRGYDTNIMKEIIKIRKMDRDERAEHQAMLDVYLTALGMDA